MMIYNISGCWFQPTPLKNLSSLVRITVLFPMYGTIKHVPNHQPVIVHFCHSYVDLLEGKQLDDSSQKFIATSAGINSNDIKSYITC